MSFKRSLRLVTLTACLSCCGTVMAQSVVESFSLGRLPYFKPSRLRQISSYDRTGGNADRLSIPRGQTAVLADIHGPGVITRIWVTIACRDPHFLRRIVLRMFWDEEPSPSVLCPIGDFFGSGFGYTHYTSLLLGMSSGGYYCYLPMPFSRRARIEVVNETDYDIDAFYYHINYQELRRLDDDVGRFHAQWRREPQTSPGKNYTILEAEGLGHFVGCNMNMQGRSGDITYLEGDEMIYVDGEVAPSIYGTGTEDYFSSGWYFNHGTYAGPLHGCIIKDEEQARVVAYRFHVGDAIPFRRSLLVTIEHGHGNEVPADYSSVAYWYQKEPHKVFPPMPPPKARIPLRVVVPSGGLEAEELSAMVVRTDSGRLVVEGMEVHGAEWSNGKQLAFRGASAGDEVVLPFQVPTSDLYDVLCFLTKGPAYGQVVLSVLGHEAACDCYAPEVIHGGAVVIPKVKLSQGAHRLVVTVTGKAQEAQACDVGVDYLLLRPRRQFVRDWLLIGPFDTAAQDDGAAGLLTVWPPERAVEVGATYVGKGGVTAQWRLVQADSAGYVNMDALLDPNDYAAAYALTYVHSPRAQTVTVYLGSDDGVRLWVNDTLVHHNPLQRPAAPDQDTVSVQLEAGWNKLLVKVVEVLGAWGFYLRIPDPEGELTFSTSPR
ncbi:MAG: DUF2961 domain-containing protein [candidate division KSB1 bacterium]|nr:DUF2961 domain-containing protein [candidate division KSB1 bacterium]